MLDSSQPNQGDVEIPPNQYTENLDYELSGQPDYSIVPQQSILNQTGKSYCTQILLDYRTINTIINQLTHRRDELLAQNSELQMEVSSLESDIAIKDATIDTKDNQIYDKNAILNQLPIVINANKNGFYVNSINDTPSSVPYTITYDNHEGTELITTAATLYPFKILNQYNGPIYRNNGNYQIAFDNAPSQPDDGIDYFEDKDLGCPINIFKFRINIPNGTETLNVIANGTYTPTSPNIGFSSVTVNVPTSSGISLKYLSLVSNGSTNTGKIGFDFENDWNYNTTNGYAPTLNAGHTLVYYLVANGEHKLSVQSAYLETSSINLTIPTNAYYVDLNYYIGSYVYLLDENNNAVLRQTVLTQSSGTNYKRTEILLNPNDFTLLT